MYFYESIGETFDEVVNIYDTNKRLSVIYDELLKENIKGKHLLDAGCGTGWFSARAVQKGAKVTSLDLGPNLLNQVKKKCKSTRVIGSVLKIPFPKNTFDVVVSSEVIEHTPDPTKALAEFYRVLKPGGVLVVTTPNKRWDFALQIANKFNLRPYQGLENWSDYAEIRKALENLGFTVEEQCGIHAFPFVMKWTYPILDKLHAFRKILGPYMVNIAIKCRK